MSDAAGKYRLEARLGGGGMAEVFSGHAVGAEGFTRRVAIKRVLPGFSDNEQFARMFVAEAQLSSRLTHPNIVSVLDFDRDAEARLFLVMEMVEGKDLDALTATGPLPVPLVVFLIAEVLRGLGYAHDLPVGADLRGLIHRDVSPHNVLLGWEGAVKVSDFGIAKARAASEASASMFIKGKPAYMSPEQANGLPLDGRSDLFAVGIMMWELLVGHRLFVGTDTRSTLAAVLFGQIPRPRAQRPDVPRDVEAVCMKLLERDLPARYATAEDAVAELVECEAAPKNGRALLQHTLAERFPQEAPLRQSVARARASVPPQVSPVPGSVPAVPQLSSRPPVSGAGGAHGWHDGPVGHGGHGGHGGVGAHGGPHGVPHGALPSLGGMMSAQTGTLGAAAAPPDPAPARAGGAAMKVALVLAITAVSGAATFGVVSLVRRPHGATASAAPGDAAGGAAGGAADAMVVAGAVPPRVDAGAALPPPPPPPPPADAGVATVPADSKKQDPPPQPAHVSTGMLTVTRFPIVTVSVDGQAIGDTPITGHRLPAGRHTLRYVNADQHVDRSLAITIEPGKLLEENLP